MLTILGMGTSLFLIVIILIRIPRESIGLSSFANNSDLLGSPGSAQRFLDIVTVTGILVYFSVAFQLNIK
jgi:preprotein translocase subunit SecG|uniref:Preprotein translocase SecG subunit n=1 Tax=Pseudo-nitzschia americana TaxID=44446 RepID=UPI001D0F7B51|nr:Preprotein translocase SecG subunit [Pseudo-nitzschia americana]UBA15103.1 Preprotein translocase SecG subunit [Pseudo-nitzschia americana]